MKNLSYGRIGLLALLILSALAYIPINHSTSHGAILAGGLDNKISVVPVFAVPYLLFLPLLWGTVVYALVTNKEFIRLALALTLVYVISACTFLVYKTYMPRPDHVTGWLSGLVRYVYAHDRPYCDVPSQHTATAVIFALYWWRQNNISHYLSLGFAMVVELLPIGVILATVLIKQHSIVGALTGLVLGILSWKIISIALRSKPAVQ